MVRIARARHAMPVVHRLMPCMGLRQRLGHRFVVLEHAYSPVGLEPAHGRGEGTAREPFTRGERIPALVARGVLDDGRGTEWTAHGHPEPRVGVAPDEPTHGVGVGGCLS